MSKNSGNLKMIDLYQSHGTCEQVFHVLLKECAELDSTLMETLKIILGPFTMSSAFDDVVEIGPLPNFQTPWSTNVMSILRNCGVDKIENIELCRRFPSKQFHGNSGNAGKFDELLEKLYKHGEFKFSGTSAKSIESVYNVPWEKVSEFSKRFGLTFDETELNYYKNVVFKGRIPTNIELFDLAQSNSEHSRHWFFNGRLRFPDGTSSDQSLFQMVRSTLPKDKTNSVIAFSDNASAIKGPKLKAKLFVDGDNFYRLQETNVYPTFNAETHNFPTTFAPFPGANTGVGGRIRDSQCVGRGGQLIAGTAGYSVDNRKLLIEASNGASDYGNKFGEPITQGFMRHFENQYVGGEEYGYRKCIMFSGGIGQICNASNESNESNESNLKKHQPIEGMSIIRIGGPAYRIGLGGGTASSRSSSSEKDLSAVQRGDPEMGNKVNRVLRRCYESRVSEDSTQSKNCNPILSIHDQGAGGMANVTKEIVSPAGATVYLDKVPLGDNSLSDLEIWCAEYQEQVTLLTNDPDIIEKMCKEERVPFCNVGTVKDHGHIKVIGRNGKDCVVDVDLDLALEHIPQKTFDIADGRKSLPVSQFRFPSIRDLDDILTKVMKHPTVGSKRYLVNKVDRSVTGLIAQQQCVGPMHTPLADVTVVANDYFGTTGIASAIGEQPIKGLFSPSVMGRLSIAEMLTNLIWAQITCLEDVKCSGNWMWPLKHGNTYDAQDGYDLYEAAKSVRDSLLSLGVSIDGGKDSLSMCKDGIKSPGTFVISGYVSCTDITKTITPNLKCSGSSLLHVSLGSGTKGLGGTIFSEVTGQLISDVPPDTCDWNRFKTTFKIIQEGIEKGYILSGHDISDGGLLSAMCEMVIASAYYGVVLDFPTDDYIQIYRSLFTEEPGLIIEIDANVEGVLEWTKRLPNAKRIGTVTNDRNVIVKGNEKTLMNNSVELIQLFWEDSSYHADLLQTNRDCVTSEYLGYANYNVNEDNKSIWKLPKSLVETSQSCNELYVRPVSENSPRVGIVREEGSNGDRELAAAFYMAGFQPVDLSMYTIQKDPSVLENVTGLAFVGGFSYSDCLGSGSGWVSGIQNCESVAKAFESFKERPDTFSLGVCNGCQMMSQLNWIPECKFVQNQSQRFESRFCNVRVENDTPSIMMKGLEGSIMGIWCAHGEGRIQYTTRPRNETLRFVDNTGQPTTTYPQNPNGSPQGITALCSDDGRHLAMMPHPERCFLNWQLPWSPESTTGKFSMWFKMFTNAYDWVQQAHNKESKESEESKQLE